MRKPDISRELEVALAKAFYESGATYLNSNITYIDVNAPYCGDVNVINITIEYTNGKPTEERRDAMVKRLRGGGGRQ